MKSLMWKSLAVIGALTAMAGASDAQLITNGNFETGAIAPWTAGGFGTIAGTGGVSTAFGQAGTWFYYLNDAPGQVVGVSQAITFTGGGLNIAGNYTSVGIGLGTNSFVVQVIDSTNTVLHQSTFNPTSTGYNPNWQPFAINNVIIPAGNYNILFIAQGNGFDDDYGIDNISATVATPEPGAVALLGLAALPGVALLRRKK